MTKICRLAHTTTHCCLLPQIPVDYNILWQTIRLLQYTATADYGRLLILHQTTTDGWILQQSTADYRILPHIATNQRKLQHTTVDFRIILQTTTYYSSLPQTSAAADNCRLLHTSLNYSRLLHASPRYRRLALTTADYRSLLPQTLILSTEYYHVLMETSALDRRLPQTNA